MTKEAKEKAKKKGVHTAITDREIHFEIFSQYLARRASNCQSRILHATMTARDRIVPDRHGITSKRLTAIANFKTLLVARLYMKHNRAEFARHSQISWLWQRFKRTCACVYMRESITDTKLPVSRTRESRRSRSGIIRAIRENREHCARARNDTNAPLIGTLHASSRSQNSLPMYNRSRFSETKYF